MSSVYRACLCRVIYITDGFIHLKSSIYRQGQVIGFLVYMLWINFILGLNIIFFCFKFIIIRYHTLRLRANGRNNSPTMLGVVNQQCCVRLHGAKSMTGFKLCATTRNNMPQGVQTDAKCNIQQCWELMIYEMNHI